MGPEREELGAMRGKKGIVHRDGRNRTLVPGVRGGGEGRSYESKTNGNKLRLGWEKVRD